jgi:hypothetical protein
MASLTEFSLAEAIAVLIRTPATLNALLRGLPNIWVRREPKSSAFWNPHRFQAGIAISMTFVSVPIVEPDLEAIRLKCSDVTLAPKNIFEDTLRAALAEL